MCAPRYKLPAPAGVIHDYFVHLQVILHTRTYFTQAFRTRDLVEKCPALQSGRDREPSRIPFKIIILAQCFKQSMYNY